MERRRLIEWLALPSSAVAALLVGAVMLAALGTNPVTGYRALVTGCGGQNSVRFRGNSGFAGVS